MTNLYFSICGLFVNVLILLLYFSKERVNSRETKLYGAMVISSFFDLFLVIFALLIAYINYSSETFGLIVLLNKIDFIHYIVWPSLLLLYLLHITLSSNEKFNSIYKKITKFLCVIDLILIIIEFVLPLNLYNIDGGMTVYGDSANFVYLIAIIYIVSMILIMITNIKKIFNKKYLPIFLLILLMIIALYIRKINPTLIVIPAIISYINLIMFFTIENPDLKMIAELNMARDQADKANNAKSEFLSSMSHEIRTPLNAIVGFSEALQDEDIPDSAKEEVKDIISASQSLLEIVNGILDISKIESGKIEIVNTEYDFNKILKDLVALTKARMGDKQLDFRTSFDPTIPAILYGDHTRVKQVILNLLTNAIKYTKKGYVEFKVSCVTKDDICRLIISVEDSGIGIKQENIDKLFSKFERFDLEKNITIEGTGLGLAITKKLVELMGGRIVVQSIYGEGSRFTVAIDQRIVAKEPIIEEEKEELGKIDVSGKKVLIVDDNSLNIKVASRLLKDYNLDIDSVTSGQECINKIIIGEYFDLILMDDMMPGKSGVETFKELRNIENFNIPTIILTANAIEGMKEKYLGEDHFNDYLSKPIDRQELDRVIRKFLVK